MAKFDRENYVPVDMDAETTDRMLALIEQNGSLPWSRPWNVSSELPRNLLTGKVYQGGNVFILFYEQLKRGFAEPFWITWKQAQQINPLVKLRDGEKGRSTHGVRWNVWVKKDEVTGEVLFAKMTPKCFSVFNVEQYDGVSAPKMEEREFVPILGCEDVGRDMEVPVEIVHIAQSRAFFDRVNDRIVLPKREQFRDVPEYYSTRFHEMIHSTGADKRLKRQSLKDAVAFGDQNYSREELVAELGAAMLCSRSGIANAASERNSAAYLQGWAKKLKEDKTLFLKASKDAQKAVHYILNEMSSPDGE